MDKERYIKIINDPIKKIEYRKANRIRVAKWKKSEKGKDYIKLYRQTQKYKDYHKEWKKRHYNSGVLLKKEVIK